MGIEVFPSEHNFTLILASTQFVSYKVIMFELNLFRRVARNHFNYIIYETKTLNWWLITLIWYTKFDNQIKFRIE